jgi:hypothetical protein
MAAPKGSAMKDNVYRFRSVKWGDPEEKLSMIPDHVGRDWQAFAVRSVAVVLGFAVGVAGGLFLL